MFLKVSQLCTPKTNCIVENRVCQKTYSQEENNMYEFLVGAVTVLAIEMLTIILISIFGGKKK